MLKTVGKVAVVVVTSAVTLPYAVAVTANLLYGWPQGPHKYRRALSPRKVLALNYSILQQLGYIRFARLLFQSRRFYREAVVMRLLKDIPFGSHDNTLDLYFPRQTAEGMKATLPQPVVVFIYGGAWGSGDKSMYSLLAAQIADQLEAIVCIPNYSTYPRGYVDDMVQDVFDSLSWIHNNIDKYGGDKECMMLIGHSAGAHLAVMGTLELTLKRLMHNPQAIIRSEGEVTPPPTSLTESFQFQKLSGSTPLSLSIRSQPGNSAVESIRFEEHHFDGSSQSGSEPANGSGISTPPLVGGLGAESASTTGSFFFVSETEKERRLSASGGSDSFYVVSKGGTDAGEAPSGSGNGSSRKDQISEETEGSGEGEEDKKEGDLQLVPAEKEKAIPEQEKPLEGGGDAEKAESKETEDLAKIDPGEQARKPDEAATVDDGQAQESRPRVPMELVIEDDDTMTRSQREVRDLLSSIRCLIGLAGVYDIVDHFEHEMTRGVEDISSMGKAMYGPEHFHRYSPTQIIATLPHRTRFPPVLLVHGDKDHIVPPSSSEKFAAAISDMGSQVVEYVVPGCPHVDLCLDLMSSSRPFYDIGMGIIRQAAQTYLN